VRARLFREYRSEEGRVGGCEKGEGGHGAFGAMLLRRVALCTAGMSGHAGRR